jgi:16S rRNA (cytosine1402-N4)-methyltransferase
LLNERSEQELSRIFWELGEDWSARRLARAVMERRKQAPLRRTMELVDIVARAMGRRRGRSRIHPATRIFQALRMAVNDELTVLSEGLDGAWARLALGGRLVVISFHSLEDRVVKIRFRRWAMEEKTGKLLNRKPMRPGDEEVRNNPRARSAKLRAIEKRAKGTIPGGCLDMEISG